MVKIVHVMFMSNTFLTVMSCLRDDFGSLMSL